MRLGALALTSLGLLLAVTTATNDAEACGGCFHPEEDPMDPGQSTRSTVVTAHRMALSISPAQTVLWDQVQYAGEPSDFAWVLPVKAGARLELGTDAWFETLDAATTTRVTSPPLNCQSSDPSGGFQGGDGFFEGGGDVEGGGCSGPPGCGASADEMAGGDFGDSAGAVGSSSGFGTGGGGAAPPEPPPVTVVHEGTVGPYETVTLHANEQGALTTWLVDHGYAIDEDIQPIIDAYSDEGFDFIALRLAPDQGVQQMKPVRVVSPGATPTLPLRMVAAGTGANVAITLFVIGEGRWEPANFPNATISPSAISWDFGQSASTYASMRQETLEAEDGRTWLTSYAMHGALLDQTPIENGFGSVQYGMSDGTTRDTIGTAYFYQGWLNGEGDAGAFRCDFQLGQLKDSADVVTDLCGPAPDGGGGAGGGGGMDPGGAGGTAPGGAGGMAPGGAGGAGTGGAGTGGEPDVCTRPEPGQIDSRLLACGELDDLAVAMTGMHPRDVWLTRIESDLPRLALGVDLDIAAEQTQGEVNNLVTAQLATNAPCPLATSVVAPPPKLGAPRRGGGKGRSARDAGMIAIVLSCFAIALARRAAKGRAISLVKARAT